MKIRIVGHNMKYEAECITMLFFPDEKIVTTEYPADTEFPEQDEEDFIEARQQRGLMKVTLHLNGRETSLCRTVLSNPRTPYEEAEYIMSDMMFTLLCEATGTHPAWGMLTGVRPIKLFHKRLDAGMSREMVAREFAQRFYVTEEKIDLALADRPQRGPDFKGGHRRHLQPVYLDSVLSFALQLLLLCFPRHHQQARQGHPAGLCRPAL